MRRFDTIEEHVCDEHRFAGCWYIWTYDEFVGQWRLDPVLSDLVIEQKKPFLGICVGMQILANSSQSLGTLPDWVGSTAK